MVYREIVLLDGETELSQNRKEWIAEFLSIFGVVFNEIDNLSYRLSSNIEKSIDKTKLFIGHEFRDETITFLNDNSINWIDIRVSPVRFCDNDFVFAIRSNNIDIQNKLKDIAITDYQLRLEAKALSLSYRWRNQGQMQIEDNAIVLFLEQEADIDSINYNKKNSVVNYKENLEEIICKFKNLYYVTRENSDKKEISYLKQIGFKELQANVYSILTSKKTEAIIGIRGGVLSEAKYFSKKIFNLDSITTPLTSTNSSDIIFNNIPVEKLLTKNTWDYILGEKNSQQLSQHSVSLSRNFLRRALNIWNSTSEAMNYKTKEWESLTGQHIFHAAFENFHLQHGSAVRGEIRLISGEWRWFNGEIITVYVNGTFKAQDDFGTITKDLNKYQFNWHKRRIIDKLELSNDSAELTGENNYKDRVSASRLT